MLDERIDMDLIARLADAHAQWQIVLAGPLCGIGRDALPRRENIHYLGPQPYEAMPQFLAGWDVCLLPFAVNEATHSHCPPMTLEYMAAELPIVGTPLPDVAGLHGDIVTTAGDAQAFIEACEAALLAAPQEHAATIDRMRKAVASTSWDATAAHVSTLLAETPRRSGNHRSADGERDAGWHAGAMRGMRFAISTAGGAA
ncbi:hypothetical protein AYR66_24940 [Noviherbaspirillum denitrificans]|uniref:Glycosyl transferase family 1 domain-containing protein n=1 Tax=Noviherbaspirillum denitrificans TaxID=1968433 RepID=A0A254TNR5_9BURK|nr:hypothetical protein AYR66_24940 [Noviherbaspirillum denitrificans]